jgi:hypothetical protein
MKPLALWRHELRRTGLAAVLAPPLAGGLVLLVAVAGAASAQVSTQDNARTMQAMLEMVLPLTAGMGAAALVGTDPVVELHLSVPTRYRGTVLRRLAVTAGWVGAVAVVLASGMVASGWWHRWPGAHPPLVGQLGWLAPTVCLAGLGLLFGALSSSPALATSVVVIGWLFDWAATVLWQRASWGWRLELFATTQATPDRYWMANRVTLLAAGGVMTFGAWLLLGRPERLLTKETQ